MKKEKIDEFFLLLDQALNQPGEIIVVGASAGSLMGHVRPSFDIDFEVTLKDKVYSRQALSKTILSVAESAGVSVNFSDNIAGWSRINYLDYRKTASVYKKFGKLSVKIVHPAYWTIGKMTRFLEFDIQDMVKIISAKKVEADELIAIWAKAFLSSDLSLELGQFKNNVLFFLSEYGKDCWGKDWDVEKSKNIFLEKIGEK